MREATAAQSLRGCALFAHASDGELAGLVRHFRRRRFRREEVIFHQGDPGESLYIVTEGAVKIVLPGLEGDEAIIATLRRGDFFGELALLDGSPRSTSAIAVEPSETLSLPRAVFRDLLDGDPALRDAFHVGVAHELRRLTDQVEELHFLDLPGRLAARLVRLARETRGGHEDVVLDWPFTQRELAAMIGGTRQSVNRLLADLVDRDLVVVERERLIIPDLAALERETER